MTPDQQAAFLAASGIKANSLIFLIRLLVGGVAVICAIFILVGLLHYLDAGTAWDKNTFILSVFMLAFVLMMIFAFAA